MEPQSRQEQLRRYLWRVGEIGLLIATVILISVVFVMVFRYVMPFVIGWLIAVLLLPVVRYVEGRGVSRVVAVITVMGSVLVCLLLLFAYMLLSIFREATLLSTNASEYISVVESWVQQEISLGQDLFGELPKRFASQLQSAVNGALNSIDGMFRNIMTGFVHSITHLPETMFVFIIAIITAFFLLVRRERMYQQFLRALPPGWSGKIQGVVRDVARAFVGTVRAQVLLMLLSCILGSIGMVLIGVQYAVLLGIVFGVFGAIPIMGSALLTVPWAIGAFLIGDYPLALKLLLLQVVISLIRHLVEPKILAQNVGLGMLSTLFGLYVGMRVLGVLGLFVGPILVIAFRSLIQAHMFRDFLPEVKRDDMG